MLRELRNKLLTWKVRAILNVENWSRFTLLDSQTDIHCGSVLPRYQATNIYPGYREVILAVGTEIFSGTCGTVSWQVREKIVFPSYYAVKLYLGFMIGNSDIRNIYFSDE